MHKRVLLRTAALACGVFPLCAAAQTTPAAPATVSPQAEAVPTAAAAACADCITIPKLTPVRVEILTDLGSKLSKTGEMFPIKLAYPIIVDGKIIIPAGAMGMGEVIFAKGSGGGGAGGELVLAARYVDVSNKRLLLRSLQVDGSGKSRIDTAMAVGVAVSGVIALFMKGKQSVVSAGTIADAKTGADISLAPDEITALAAAAAAMPTTGPQSVSAAPAPAAALQPASQAKGK